MDPVGFTVGAGFAGRHAVTLVAKKCDVDLKRFRIQSAVPQGIENMMGVERPVVISHAGVITPDNQVRTAKVLANQRVQQGLTRSRVAHLDRITRLYYGARHKIMIDHCLDRTGAHISRNVSGLQLAKNLVYEYPVGDLNGDLHQVFVRPLHRVAGLKRCHLRPSIFLEHGPGFCRADIQFRIFLRILTFRQAGYRSSQVYLALPQDFLYSGVGGVSGVVDVLTFQCLIGRIFFRHLHDREDFTTLAVDQRNLFLDVNAVCKIIVTGKCDRNWPEDAVFELHIETGAAPVRLVHEPFNRRIGAHRHHQHVRHLAACHRHFP